MELPNRSVWEATSEHYSFPPFEGELTVDVAIIGGGITGVTTAALLSKAGKKVALLEAHSIGKGSTGGSTGNLYETLSERLYTIDSKHPEDTLRAVVQSRHEAVDLVEQLVREHDIECGFKRVPLHIYSITDPNDEDVSKEIDAMQKAVLNPIRNAGVPLPMSVKSSLTLEGQAQFNPAEYVIALAKSIAGDNCRIYEQSAVTEVHDGDPIEVRTARGVIRAARVIMATHTPKGALKVHTVLGPYREYGIAVTLNGGYPPPGIYYSTENPHHSVRPHEYRGQQYLIVVGGKHKVGQESNTERCYTELERWARQHFDVTGVAYRWSAQGYQPADGLPYIGESGIGDYVYEATGFATNGLTYGTVAAMIFADICAGKQNKWASYYDPARWTPLASAKDFMKENANVAVQYLKDLPASADAEQFVEVSAGEGKVMELDGEKYGVYRDERSALHVVSAVCTHLACIVTWNNGEKSWDCPCHGSRFTVDGEVIEGPATMALPKRKLGKKEE